MTEGDKESQDQAWLLSQGPSCLAGWEIQPSLSWVSSTKVRELYGPCNTRKTPLTASLYLKPLRRCLSKNVWASCGRRPV